MLDGKRLAFHALDVTNGKGRELASVDVSSSEAAFRWDLSPDGSLVALPINGEAVGRIHVISLTGKPARDVMVPGWTPTADSSVYWSSDGNGWYTSGESKGGTDLIYIDQQGHMSVLRHHPDLFQTWAVPSLDGMHLAFAEWTSASNVWLLENF